MREINKLTKTYTYFTDAAINLNWHNNILMILQKIIYDKLYLLHLKNYRLLPFIF